MVNDEIPLASVDLHLNIEVDYTPFNKNWFYSYVDIPNWQVIQQEILAVHSNDELTSFFQVNPHYFNLKADVILQYCPTLKEFLKDKGILEKFDRVLFSSKNKNPPVKTRVPHTDSLDGDLKYSLNMPLSNCEDSYLIWSAFLGNGKVLRNHKMKFHNYGWTLPDNVTEICRVEYDRPMLVNVTVLHNAEFRNPDRAICGLRFNPDLTDDDLKRLNVVIPKE